MPVNEDYIKEAGQEGARAYREGVPYEMCPHPHGTAEGTAWRSRYRLECDEHALKQTEMRYKERANQEPENEKSTVPTLPRKLPDW